MDNPITNWSFDIPTKPGLYLVCYGDVETEDSVSQNEFYLNDDGDLVDVDGVLVKNYASDYKFARLVFAASELAELNDE